MKIKKLSKRNRLIDNKRDCRLFTDGYTVDLVHFMDTGKGYIKEHVKTIINKDEKVGRRTEKKFLDIITKGIIQ